MYLVRQDEPNQVDAIIVFQVWPTRLLANWNTTVADDSLVNRTVPFILAS